MLVLVSGTLLDPEEVSAAFMVAKELHVVLKSGYVIRYEPHEILEVWELLRGEMYKEEPAPGKWRGD